MKRTALLVKVVLAISIAVNAVLSLYIYQSKRRNFIPSEVRNTASYLTMIFIPDLAEQICIRLSSSEHYEALVEMSDFFEAWSRSEGFSKELFGPYRGTYVHWRAEAYQKLGKYGASNREATKLLEDESLLRGKLENRELRPFKLSTEWNRSDLRLKARILMIENYRGLGQFKRALEEVDLALKELETVNKMKGISLNPSVYRSIIAELRAKVLSDDPEADENRK